MKRTVITRKSPLIRGSMLRKQSPKRALASRIYAKKRLAFLKKHPVCQWYLAERLSIAELGPKATEIHHRAGRSGSNYLDESTWMAVCRKSHEWIHAHPKEAREKGYLI